MDNPDTVLETAGLGPEFSRPPKLEKIRGFMCEICCDDEAGLDTYAMKCDHRYCVNCFRQYLESKIKDEGEAARIQCPSEGCSRIVDSKSIKILVPTDIYAR
jgi:ariadne-1